MADFHSSEYLNMDRQWNDRSPYVNQSLFNPEWVYGVRNMFLHWFTGFVLTLPDDVPNRTSREQTTYLAHV